MPGADDLFSICFYKLTVQYGVAPATYERRTKCISSIYVLCIRVHFVFRLNRNVSGDSGKQAVVVL